MEFSAKILYLDFDGVLHPEDVYWKKKKGIYLAGHPNHCLFENCALLEELLAPYPDVRIVLSTSWVRALRSYTRTRKRLTPGLQSRCIGATYHSAQQHGLGIGYRNSDLFFEKTRYTQIIEDKLRRCPTRALAIDDYIEGWPDSEKDWLVAPFTARGIAEPAITVQLKEKFKYFFT